MKTALLIFAFTLLAGNTFAQDYFVSDTGSDMNPGTLALPFATIQHGYDACTPCTNVFIRGGTYPENLLLQTNSGTMASPINIKNYAAEEVHVDGGGAAAIVSATLMSISNVNYITINGLIFQNNISNYAKGVIINSNCDHITVTNCKFTNINFSADSAAAITSSYNVNPLIAYGISATQPITHITFSNNEVYHCRTGYSEGITVNGNVDTFTIDGNTVHDLTNIGIVAAGHYGVCPDSNLDQARNGTISNNTVYNCVSPISKAGEIYVDGGKNIIVENNTTSYGQVGISIGCENIGKSADHIIVRNNISFNNSYSGIEAGGFNYPLHSGKVIHAALYGNSCYRNNSLSTYWAGELNVMYNDSLTVKNNIFYAENPHNIIFNYYSDNGLGNVFNYNDFYITSSAYSFMFGTYYGSFDLYKSGTGNDANSVFADPLFTNPAMSDFHLRVTSPAINAGDPAYVAAPGETDMDGEARCNGAIDCGADETYYTLDTHTLSLGADVKIFPTMASEHVTVEFSNAGSGTVIFDIFNVLGQRQSSQTFNVAGMPIKLNVKNLKPGMYYLQINQSGNIQYAKFNKI